MSRLWKCIILEAGQLKKFGYVKPWLRKDTPGEVGVVFSDSTIISLKENGCKISRMLCIHCSQSSGPQQKTVKKPSPPDNDTSEADKGKRSSRNAAVASLEPQKNDTQTFSKKVKKVGN